MWLYVNIDFTELLFISFLGLANAKLPATIDCIKQGRSLCDITHRFLKSRYKAKCGGSGCHLCSKRGGVWVG